MPSVSIVIPAYNNKEALYKLLASIRQARQAAPGTEVIVVDDCSPGDLSAHMRKDFDFVTCVRLPKRSGPATARNKGAEASSGDVILFLDSDVIVKGDTISKVKRAFERRDVTALEGEYDIEPANKGFFPRYKALEYRSFVRGQEYITILGPRICAIRKAVFWELGGFVASYQTASVEDYELSHRLHDKGYKIHYDKTLDVQHHFTERLTKQLKISFHRTHLWTHLFLQRRKFDNFGTTFQEGIGRLAGFLLIVSVFFAPFSRIGALISCVLFLVYLILNSHFFLLVLRKEGSWFLIGAIVSHIAISVSITLGFLYGVITACESRLIIKGLAHKKKENI